MSRTPLHPMSLHEFKSSLHGTLIDPGDERYESTRRVWNGLIDKHPAFIVLCAGVSDIVSSIQFARDQGLTVAVRGGGHGLAGYAVCDDGIVIDLSQMKGIYIDSQQSIAYVEPGCKNADLLRAAQPYGLATTTGIVGDVGIAGLTLGGGEGWLSGKYGLASDNLLAVEMVLADGSVVHASNEEYPDLFWAVRGGSGNFGIITAFTFQLHQVGQVLRGSIIHPISQAQEVLRFYREFSSTVPDELTVYADLVTGKGGQPIIMLNTCYCGDDLAEGERLLIPLRTFGSPLVDSIHPMSLLEATTLLDDFFPSGRCIYPQTETVLSLNDELIDIAVAYTMARPSEMSSTGIRHTHGTTTRIEPSATAFPIRSEHYVIQIMAQWTQGERQPHVDWANHFQAEIAPFTQELVPVNWLGEVSKARIQAGYGANYERMAQIKR
ncbi:MAG: FAD-binding oxidoreductase, partial [Ktedonobacteraceae bacterium]